VARCVEEVGSGVARSDFGMGVVDLDGGLGVVDLDGGTGIGVFERDSALSDLVCGTGVVSLV
jgi:hypothetical protein